MRILLTRPREDSESVAARLAGLGHEAIVAPLIEIELLDGVELSLAGVQALLATSSNGVRALAAHREAAAALNLPLFAVGDATARMARAAGFEAVRTADGDVESLAALARKTLQLERGRLVHIAGRDRAGDLKALLAADGFTVDVAVLYAAQAATALPEEARAALQAGTLDAVLLYSPRTARIYADLVGGDEALLAAVRRMHHVCLSQAVAARLEPLGLDPQRILVAAEPKQDALLRRLGEIEPAR